MGGLHMSVKNIIVFIRGHNDFDHVLPILDYLVREKSKETEVTIYTHLYVNDSCKKHLLYCEKELKKEVIPFNKKHFRRIDRFLLDIVRVLNKNTYPNYFVLNLLETNLRRFLQAIASVSVKRFMKNLPSNSTVLADFGTENHFPYKYFIRYSKNFNIPIIAYLHGYYIFVNLNPFSLTNNKLRKTSHLINKYLFGRGDRSYYDRYLVGPGQKYTFFRSHAYRNFVEISRVMEIGIPRFTKEWIDVLSKNNRKDKNSVNIKVALFISNVKFDVNAGILNELINRVAAEKGVELIVVPHTRAGLSGLSHKNIKLVTQKNSSEAIDWSDVGIAYGTSMIFEMIVKGVEVIVPKFIDSNKTIFEENNVCIEAYSIENLIEHIHNIKLREKKYTDKYSKEFIKKYVYGGFNTYENLMNEFYNQIIKTSK